MASREMFNSVSQFDPVVLDQAAVWRVWRFGESPPCQPEFLLVVWRDSSNMSIYLAHFPGRQLRQFHLGELSAQSSTHIPFHHFQPRYNIAYTEFTPDAQSRPLRIKTPRLLGYDGTPGIANSVARELTILETLRKHPHPSIGEYRGCLFVGGLVTGICMTEYQPTLAAVFNNHVPSKRQVVCHLHSEVILLTPSWAVFLSCSRSARLPFQCVRLLQDVFDGISHLHSLKFAHNNIKPSNVALDQLGRAVIVDFGNSAPFGAPCRAGSPGWTNYSRVSAPENDKYAYECLQQYAESQVAPINQSATMPAQSNESS
jgi:serine/threonine protein kinase